MGDTGTQFRFWTNGSNFTKIKRPIWTQRTRPEQRKQRLARKKNLIMRKKNLINKESNSKKNIYIYIPWFLYHQSKIRKLFFFLLFFLPENDITLLQILSHTHTPTKNDKIQKVGSFIHFCWKKRKEKESSFNYEKKFHKFSDSA